MHLLKLQEQLLLYVKFFFLYHLFLQEMLGMTVPKQQVPQYAAIYLYPSQLDIDNMDQIAKKLYTSHKIQ